MTGPERDVPAIKPGDKLWLDGPHGVFSMDREQAMGYVFIGGGIGITPLYSMLQTMAGREDVRPVLLFYGAPNSETMTFREELVALSEQMNLGNHSPSLAILKMSGKVKRDTSAKKS